MCEGKSYTVCTSLPLLGPSIEVDNHRDANVMENKYIYLEDLLGLQACRLLKQGIVLGSIVSPLHDKLHCWRSALTNHPDQPFAHNIIDGLSVGFRIGFDYSNCSCTPARKNLLSVSNNSETVQQYLQDECRLGRVLGPLPSYLCSTIQVSPFGVIPKPSKPGQWRLIVDLSSPQGASVNDGISSKWASLAYVSVDQIVDTVLQLGQGSQLAKIDVKNAFRIIPVHPDDRHLLGMQWSGRIYVDCVLPFGLRSAPKIFNAVADALQWCLRHKGIEFVYNYLDDFLCIGPPGKNTCRRSLDTMMQVCAELGVPLASEKVEGPSL